MDSQEHSLVEAKKQRKQLENDAQLLSNRIKLLEQEEYKTWKKIEETKKRANDIMAAKNKQRMRQEQKYQQMMIREQQEQQRREMIQRTRDSRNKDKTLLKKAMNDHKLGEALQAKAIKEINYQKRAENLSRIQQENEQKVERIRTAKRIGQQRIQSYRMGKRAQSRDTYIRKVENEDATKANTEKEVMEMELLEMALIKKLQAAQLLQKQAYEELEQVNGN